MASASVARRGSDDPMDIIAQEAGARLTVRRASGQRAESESIVGMRRNSANRQLARRVSASNSANRPAKQAASAQVDTLSSSQSVKSNTSTTRSLANGVRKIFRSRSKSQSTPSHSGNRANDPNVIMESPEDAARTGNSLDKGKAATTDYNKAQAHARRSVDSHHRRSKDSSSLKNSGLFSFGRAKTPTRSTVDWEGVEAEIRRASIGVAGGQDSAAYDKGKSRQVDGQPYSSWSPYDTPKPREVHLSDGLPPPSSSGPTTTVFDIVSGDSSERQATSLTPRSPRRRSSLALSESVTPKGGMLELPPTSSDPSTPVNERAGDYGAATAPGQSRIPSSLTKVNTNVPKMWQFADPARPSVKDDMQSGDSMLGKQRFGSSTTASVASFRTAQSFRDAETPSPRHAYGADTYESAHSLARSASSPLSDLIGQLDQQFLPSSSATPALLHRPVPISDRLAELRRPDLTPSPVSVRLAVPQDGVRISSRNADVDRPRSIFGDEDDDDVEDEDESTFSRVSAISSNSHASPGGKRNTFGAGEALNAAAGTTSVTPTAGVEKRDDDDNDGDGEQNRRDVSMYEIESSLAAVEAALRDHSVAGSLDPNPLLAHIRTPVRAARRSTGDVSALHGGPIEQNSDDYFPQPEASQISLPQNEEEERLARITLPPEQQHAIADAVRQVRRAISSSHLPQIPNEDESDVGRSPLAEVMLGSDFRTAGRPNGNGASGHELEGVEAGDGPALVEQPTPPHKGAGLAPIVQRTRSSPSHDSTPMRAARIRQESMHDVEQAYARMVELVTSAAGIDLTPSPMPNMRFFARQSVQSQDSVVTPNTKQEPRSSALSYMQHQNASPLQQQQQQRYVRDRVQSAAPVPSVLQPTSSELPSVLRPLAPPAPPLPPIAATSSRSARQQLLRESDALSRFMGHLPDLSEEVLDDGGLRGRSSNVSLGSRGSRRAASESPPRYYQRETSKNGVAQYGQQQAKANAVELVRGVNGGGASSSAAGSGGGTANDTSPSHTIKTQGTPHTLEDERHGTPAEVAASYGLNRSVSEQAHEWTSRSRYSPASSRIPQDRLYDGVAGASTREAKQLNASGGDRTVTDDHVHRRMRASQMSGSSSRDQYGASAGHLSPAFASGSGAAYVFDNATNRRSGSSRDWAGRMDEVDGPIYRPASNASGTHGTYNRSLMQRGQENASNDAPDAARLALLQSRISSPASSLAVVQRRHALERDSLLDMLDRTRSEAMETRARNERLQADLHLEVTRVLELERELQRQRDREEQLAARVQALEEDLKAEQADRVRIGELLERVQRAVDEAASARAGSGAHRMHDDESVTDDLEEDEVMEMVHVRDGDTGKRGMTSSPTSSSTSILQEDLLPIKRRVFDSLGGEDDGRLNMGRRMISNPALRMHPSPHGDTTQDGSESIVDAVDLLDVSYDQQDRYESDAHFDRSPSLQSHASVLGLRTDDHEMGWSLDEEAPPELRDVTPPPHADDESADDAAETMQSRRKDATRTRKTSSSDDGMAERARYPSVLTKRVSLPPPQHSPSRLPVLASKSSAASSTAPLVHGAMSKSTSDSTVVPLTSSNDGKWRFPSVLSSGSTRPSIGERMRQGSAGSSQRYVNGSGNTSSVGESSLPLSPSLRFASQGSRTTGGDTSYSAQTVSPIGSFIPTFPSMSGGGGGQRLENGARQEPSGRIRSPPLSPSQRLSAYGGAANSKVPLSSAMRSAGGYYDTRRPAGYDPVDTSAMDALSGEDSSGYN